MTGMNGADSMAQPDENEKLQGVWNGAQEAFDNRVAFVLVVTRTTLGQYKMLHGGNVQRGVMAALLEDTAKSLRSAH